MPMGRWWTGKAAINVEEKDEKMSLASAIAGIIVTTA
jgi:hypothetical protein